MKTPRRNQSDCWAAMSAPSAMAWSLAQTMSGWTVGNFPNVANPQSDPACTLKRKEQIFYTDRDRELLSPFPPHDVRELQQSLGHEPGVLDVVAGGVDDPWDEYLVLRYEMFQLFEHVHLVGVSRVGSLEQQY